MNGEARTGTRTSSSSTALESALAQLLRGLDDSAVLLAANGTTVLVANHAFGRHVARPIAEIEGHDWRSLEEPEVVDERMRSIKRAIAERREVDFVERRLGRVTEHRVVPIVAAGLVTYLVHVARDAHGSAPHSGQGDRGVDIERTGALAARERSEAQLRAAQRLAHVGHFTLGLDGETMVWSEELFRIAGRDPASFVPTVDGLLAMVHRSDRDRVRGTLDPSFLRLCVASAEGRAALHGMEYRLIRPDGTVRWLRAESEVTFDAAGAPVTLLGVVHDITELRRLEEARLATHQRYQALVETSPYGIYEIDREGQFHPSNAACRRMLASGRAVGREPFVDLVAQTDRDRVSERVCAAFAGEASEFEFTSLRGRRIRSTLTPLRDLNGKLARLMGTTVDITESTRVQAALQRSERGLVEAQRIGKVGSWEIDLVTGRRTWSEEIFRICELDKDTTEPSHEASLRVVHPDDRDFIRDAYARSLATRTPMEVVIRMRMADGRIKWVQERCETVYDASGKPLRSRGTTHDISQLMRAEEALRKNETRFRNVVESFPSGVLLADAEGRIVLANRQLLLQFGYRAEELVGQRVEVLVPRAARAHHARERAGYQAASQARPMGRGRDLHGVRKDGSLFPVEIGLQPIEMPDGAMTLATVVDITERTRAQEELRLHSQVLLGMAEGAHFIDGDGIIRFTNPALDAMFGYEPAELLGKHVSILNDADPEDNARIVAEIIGTTRRVGRWEGELRNRRKDGSTFYSRVRISALEAPSGVLFVGIQEDITQRRANEQRIRDSLREKETLLREVHHRVKNNLQVVCSLLSLQRSTVGDESARAVLVECEDRVRIIAMIHEQLYQSSDLGAIELGGHIRAIAAKMGQAQGDAGLRIDCDDGLIVALDAALPLGFIFHELVTNALKHARPRGARAVQVRLERTGDALVMTVRDDGEGFPPDWKARARSTLGLNLVLALAHQLDGRFELRNEGGAVAEVTVPLQTYNGGEPT